MKVKNGIASSRSFDTMPNTRSGRLERKSTENKPAWMLTKPKNRPSAMSENATGKPISRNTIRPANMMGAMLATIAVLRRRPLVLRGKGHRASEHRRAAHDLGHPLQREQREAEWQNQLDRPAQQPAGVG